MKNKNRMHTILYMVISIICIIIGYLARYYNPGWLFIILGPLLLQHGGIFTVANYMLSKKTEGSVLAKILFIFSCLTFIAFYILMPDGGDTGGGYAVFQTIRDETLLNMMGSIGFFCFIINIVLIIFSFSIRKKTSDNLKDRSKS